MQPEAKTILKGDSFLYEFSLSQNDLDAFVSMSGDCNDIHHDELAATESPIGPKTVPGMLTAMVFSRVLGTMFPGHGTVYRSQSLDFRRPVRIGEKYVASFCVQEVIPERHRAVIDTIVAEKQTGEVCLCGTAVVINLRRL